MSKLTKTTITEALDELNTIQKRLEKKRTFIQSYLSRPDGIRDPLEKSGGSVDALRRESQSIRDLELRHLAIRMAIQQANQQTKIRIGDQEMTVAEWLTWRKEVAPGIQRFNQLLREQLAQVRKQAQGRGAAVVQAVATTAETKPTDYVVNVDEAELNKEAEAIEEILGTLDGRLSLVNATTTIELAA